MLNTDSVTHYLERIGTVALLTAAEEVELAIRIEAGLLAEDRLSRMRDAEESPLGRELRWLAQDGASAKTHLTCANLRLVVSIARHYVGRGLDFSDLIQEGNLGLIRAVEMFDYTAGFKFSTSATWHIRQAIQRGIANQAHTIRIPVHTVDAINMVARVRREMRQDRGREPTLEELSREVGMTPKKIVELQSHVLPPRSIEDVVQVDLDGGREVVSFGDSITDDRGVDPAESAEYTMLREQIERALDRLSDREAGVIRMRFGLRDGAPKNLGQVAAVLGISPWRVRQIESKTMAKLRHPLPRRD